MSKPILPDYKSAHVWELYSAQLATEYTQSIEEGKDIERYKALFDAVSALPPDEKREKLADVIFDIVTDAPIVEGYKYNEPSTLEEIRALRKSHEFNKNIPDRDTLYDKIRGAWYSRICGCLLGKTVEGIRLHELIPFLKKTGNYPMHRYILHSDITDEIAESFKFPFRERCYADKVEFMPADDDTNYMVLAQTVIEKYSRDFTPRDIAKIWLALQSKNAYCTAERVAFCNFVRGYTPPASAIYKNPYREWIGAQIRGDYFGYINPGKPELAADMAFRDASISHIKNGIYGEMFVAAMIACAAVTDSLEDIILGGLGEIPATSRLYEQVYALLSDFRAGVSKEECFKKIYARYDDTNGHDWCHTISNALIVTASLLYGGGNYGKSICMSVEAGFDTDCNGATVGSILGMRGGYSCVGEEWKNPINGKLQTTIFGYDTIDIDEACKKTMEHM
ncbi:MAG: ADP-ribosylglycohydrolase family protein [Clostridiales bacterium]|nr:ADP-ribosylglycohydrolase family protein [Clostridiales bacterium]